MKHAVVCAAMLATSLTGGVRAEVRCDRLAVDAGEVRCGPVLVREFVLENTGPAAVELDASRTSCGCLKPRLDRTTLGPGERATLRFEVNTLSQAEGTERWTVRVTARDVGQPVNPGQGPQEIDLTVTGTVHAEVRVQPAALTVYSDRPVTHELVVTDSRPKPFNVTAVRTSSRALSAKVADHRRGANGFVETVIRLDVNPEPGGARHDETVSLYTDDPDYPELSVPVGVVPRDRSRVAALPATVRVSADAGQPVPSTIVLLSDRDGGPVVIDGVDSDHPAVTATWARGPGVRSTIRVRVDRAKCVGVSVNAAVTVRLKEPAGVNVMVPVSCVLP